MGEESWIKDLQARLGKLNQRIKELGKKAANFGDGINKEYREQLEGLKTRSAEIRKKLKEIQEKGGKAPEKIKGEADQTLKNLRKSYEDLRKKMKFEKEVEMEEIDKTQLISVQDLMGMPVIDSAANDFGQIDNVYVNVREGKIENIVIKTGIRRKRHKTSPSEIKKIGDKVILNVERKIIEERESEE